MPPEFLAFFEFGIIAVLVFGATIGTLVARHKEKKEAERKGGGAQRPQAPAEPRRFHTTTRRFPPRSDAG